MFKIGILTVSDLGSRGERVDKSGPVLKEGLEFLGEVIAYEIIPDEKEVIKDTLNKWCEQGLDLILTTGGTGFSKRDVTPEATLEIMDRNAPGIAEALRANSMLKTNRAMLSRGMSVIKGSTLIINLPGSPIACQENLEVLKPVLEHGLAILKGEASNCARTEKSS